MVRAVLPFYAEEVVGAENVGTWVAILTGIAIVTMIATIPLFVRLAERTSKRDAFSLAMLGAVLAFPLLFFAGFIPGIPDRVEAGVLMVIVGVPLAGVFLLPANLTADIIDDELERTGLRREATYYGAQNFVERTATAIALPTVLLLLLFGRTAEDPLGIRLVGPAAGLFVFVGFLIFRSYRLPDAVRAPVVPEPVP